MTTPARKNLKNPEHTNRKIDKIINRITKSPTKQPRQEIQQLISITSADHSTPAEQFISIIPAHHSTPSEQSTTSKATTELEDPAKLSIYNNQLVTQKHPEDTNTEPTTCNNQLVTRSPDNINTNEQQQTPSSSDNVPEERQNSEEITEAIHMEEDHGDTATLISISSLITEEIEALDKIFD